MMKKINKNKEKLKNLYFKIKRSTKGKNLVQVYCDLKIFRLFKNGDLYAIGDFLVKFSKHTSISTWALTFYIGKVVFKGIADHLDDLIGAEKIRKDHLPLLISAKNRVSGNLVEAVKCFDGFSSESRLVNFKVAQAKRSIYHQKNDALSKVQSGVDYINSEDRKILIEYSLHIAGTAENINEEDAFKFALNRTYKDILRVKKNKAHTREFWREATIAALHFFDLDMALLFALRAKKIYLPGASKEYSRIKDLKNRFSKNKDILEKANKNILKRIGAIEGDINYIPPDFYVVVNAATLRSNSIDYPGFRNDIIFVYNAIADNLKELDVNFDVIGKLIVHGDLNLDKPYFSYHTVSGDKNGIHFKEYDRPHCFSFDAGGYSGWAEVANVNLNSEIINKIDSEVAKNFFEKDSKFVIKRGISKYKQNNDLDENLPSDYVFVALQIDGDAVQSLAYFDTLAMLKEVQETCSKLNIPVVIKRHPYCKSPRITNYLNNVDGDNVFVATGNIHKLIENSIAVCVINSAVGSEALLHKKIVYAFGRSEYMGATIVCENIGDFKKKFKINAPQIDFEKVEKFWYFVRNVYSIDLTNKYKAYISVKNLLEKAVGKSGVY